MNRAFIKLRITDENNVCLDSFVIEFPAEQECLETAKAVLEFAIDETNGKLTSEIVTHDFYLSGVKLQKSK